MAPYFGLRGAALNQAIIWLVVCPAFVCYGYNQGVTGGLLTLNSFNEQFPQMNTLTTKGAQQHHNSTIQGESGHGAILYLHPMIISLLTAVSRYGRRPVYRRRYIRLPVLHLPW